MTTVLFILVLILSGIIISLWNRQRKMMSVLQDIKKSVDEPAEKKEVIPSHKDIENEFIRAHKRQLEVKMFNARVSLATRKMEVDKKERRKLQWPEYIEWCKKNRVQPIFKNEKSLKVS